ncbi:MAG: RND family transporter [bacterium]
MRRFAMLVTRYPKWVLAAILVITIYLGFGISKLQTRNNYDAELPKEDPIVRTNDRFAEIFGEKDVIMIGIESDDIFQARTLQKIALISEDLKNVNGVIEDEVTSLSTVNNIKGRDWGLEVGPFMKTVPRTEAEIERLRADVRSNRLIYGRLVSEDETATLITANIERGYDQGRVYDQIQRILEKYREPEKIYTTGEPIMQQEIDLGIQGDVSFLLPIALTLVLIGFFVSFRTWRGVFLPFGVVALSIFWTMGLMGHVGLPLTVVSSALPMLLVAVASSYGIHIVHRYYEEIRGRDRVDGTRTATEKITPPILMTGITSALGSATLMIFRVVSIREFGIITAMGILAALILSLTFTPAALAMMKKSSKKQKRPAKGWIERALTYLAELSLANNKSILAIAAVVILISMLGISKIKVGNDFVQMFPKHHRVRETFEMFNEKLGGSRYFNIMIEGKNYDSIKDPLLLQKIFAFQQFAEGFEEVGYTSSFADIIQHMNKVMHGDDPQYHRIPDSQELIAQYLLLYSMSGDPGDFDDLVDYDYQRAKIRVMVKTSEQEAHKSLYQAFQHYVDTHFDAGVNNEFGGLLMVWIAQIRYIVTGKIQNIVLAVVIVFLFCAFVFRSLAGGLFSITPLVVATLLTFGLMGFTGIRLDMGTAIITAIAVGIGVDFAIHYISRFKEEIRNTGELRNSTANAMGSSGKAIIYDMMSNILGFVVFIFSGFLPIQYFGWLISLTMLTVGFGTLVILPALFATFNPKFVQGRGPAYEPPVIKSRMPVVAPIVADDRTHVKYFSYERISKMNGPQRDLGYGSPESTPEENSGKHCVLCRLC